MKRIERNEAVRVLRKIIGLTQAEFAVMIGASKDAVVSLPDTRRRKALRKKVSGTIQVPF